MGRDADPDRAGRPQAYPGGPRLIANIGARFARFALETAPGAFEQMQTFACAGHAGMLEVCRAYLARVEGPAPIHAVLALATPVTGDRVHLTNRDWSFSIDAIRAELGLQTLLAVNDFLAMAMALPRLSDTQRRQIGGGRATADGVIGLLGASTGLGTSALVPRGGRWITLPSEGGHASFAPADETQVTILRHAWKRWEHVSAERLLSAPGLVLMHDALREAAGAQSPGPSPAADTIIRRGVGGEDPLCATVLECFCDMLGTQAANLALTLNATGGIYVGSTIVRALGEFLPRSGFRRAFERKGRFSGFTAAIPTYMILTDQCSLFGAAQALREHLEDQGGAGRLLDHIRAEMDSFTPAERRVARLVLEQPRTVLKEPVAEIAARADVSQPTVIRFCRSLGLQGLSDFKLKLASGLTGAVPVRRSQVTIDDGSGELAAKVLDNTGAAIARLRDELDANAVERAIALLANARRIEFYGAGNSSVAALDGQHKFFRFGIPANAYADAQVQAMAAAMLGEGDVVVAISRSGNSIGTLQATDAAVRAGASVIAITAAGSPLAQRARVALELTHDEQGADCVAMVARVLHLLIVDILAVGVAMRRLAATGAGREADADRGPRLPQDRLEALISHANPAAPH